MKESHDDFEERLSSARTTVLFALLSLVFSLLALWRIGGGAWGRIGGLFAFLGGVFLFYTLNFRVLQIRLTDRSLILRFGVISWHVRRDNIAACEPDDPPWLLKYGGAGVHFFTTGGRYRVSFNFLEHPRVVIRLKEKTGLVKDVSFSTARPEEWVKKFL